MRKLVSILLAFLVYIGLSAQDYQQIDTTACNIDSLRTSYIESLSDSLAVLLDKREYEAALVVAEELNQQDTLSNKTLLNCADSYLYMSKYDECLNFCDKWEKKIQDAKQECLFELSRAEAFYYLKDYQYANKHFANYNSYLNNYEQTLTSYYSALYATSLHETFQYAEAETMFGNFLMKFLEREGLTLENAHLCEAKDYLGRYLYKFAFNSFFMGDESTGMVLLEISSKCGNEYATRDYNHLTNCQTLMMEVNPSYKYKNQFDAYLEKYDFRYNSIEHAEDFWSQLVERDVAYNELCTEMAKTKRRKMLQKAWDEVQEGRSNMTMHLKNLYPYEVSNIETGLVKSLTGENQLGLSDFRIYPANDANAFATPYGQIYLTSGLVLKYNFNNHLLLGVCAHEMTHYMCQHSLLNLWKQYEKERKNEIWGGIVAGLYAVSMTAAGIYGASNGVEYDQSYYDNIAIGSTNLYSAIANEAFYFQFKYSRDQEIQSDLMAYRFCEAMGVGGYAYIMALQLLSENDLYMKADRTADHPTMAYRISFLKYVYKLSQQTSNQ